MLDVLRSVDHNIFYWLNNNLVGSYNWLDLIWKFLAVYLIYLVPIGLLVAWFFWRSEKSHKTMLAAFLSGAVSWQIVSAIIGSIHFRLRPFANLAGAKEIVFHVPTYSFPSDHAAFLAALTCYFYLAGYKKVGNLMLAITILISFARVVTGLHWPFDIIAGWIVGILVALIFWFFRKPIEKWILNPILWVLRKIKLA